MRNVPQKNEGQVLVQVIVFSTIAIVVIGALVSWAGINIKAARMSLDKERSIQLAESGIDYYRWHLAHAPTDYKDGKTTSGPYVHSVLDKNGNVSGQFSLNIIPPPLGSTKVRIESTGTSSSSPTLSRRIAVELAIPSLAKFAVVANADLRFGQGTEVFGPIHSNGGIRFDGLAHNLITSGVANYDDPDHAGGNEFGVHTHVVLPSGNVSDTFRALEAPPNLVQARIDVFEVGRLFPLPAVDFAGLTTDLAVIRSSAQSSGRYLAPSGSQGYQIILRTNDTFDVYRVTSQMAVPNNCNNPGNQTGWGTWSINNRTFVANYVIPANGLVFVEDNVWVEGTINTARVTIASGRFPDNVSTRTSITINNNLLYTNYNGSDSVGLIAQNNICLLYTSPSPRD